MFKIRLHRQGRKRVYHYAVVAVDVRRDTRTGLARKIGYYDPTKSVFVVDYAIYDQLILTGTQPTEKIKLLVQKYRK